MASVDAPQLRRPMSPACGCCFSDASAPSSTQVTDPPMPMDGPMLSRSTWKLVWSSSLALAFAACVGPRQQGTAPARSGGAAATAPATSAAALNPAPQVRLRIEGGALSEPQVHPAFGKATLSLTFPAGFEGTEVDLVVDRTVGAERREWLRLRPRLRADGSLQLTGLPGGRYALRAEDARGVVVTGAAEVETAARAEVAMRNVSARSARRRGSAARR